MITSITYKTSHNCHTANEVSCEVHCYSFVHKIEKNLINWTILEDLRVD